MVTILITGRGFLSIVLADPAGFAVDWDWQCGLTVWAFGGRRPKSYRSRAALCTAVPPCAANSSARSWAAPREPPRPPRTARRRRPADGRSAAEAPGSCRITASQEARKIEDPVGEPPVTVTIGGLPDPAALTSYSAP